MFSDFLRDPALSGIDVDSEARMTAHKNILERKPMIKDVFTEIHHLMWRLSRTHLTGDGLDIEIGSGVYPMKESFRSVIATDIVRSAATDRVLDAQKMDLPPASVRTVFGQHTFHHLPEPERFLNELRRVLVPGGGAVLVEPYWSLVAATLFKHLFREEKFDKSGGWVTETGGAMSGANQALSYIVFKRDHNLYKSRFPDLPVVYQAPLSSYLRYLLSGGLNFRQIVPTSSITVLRTIESALKPFNKFLALHHIFVIRKQ